MRPRIPMTDHPEVVTYYKQCLEVCWLAAVQDPPLAIESTSGETFNNAIFRDYTARGPYVEYVVRNSLVL